MYVFNFFQLEQEGAKGIANATIRNIFIFVLFIYLILIAKWDKPEMKRNKEMEKENRGPISRMWFTGILDASPGTD